jgi:hypothetical protein
MDQRWIVDTVDGGHVRLRSGKIGLVSIDATAPVSGGELALDGDAAAFTLRLDLGQMRTGNFLMQAAARSLISSNNVHVLVYEGHGHAVDGGWRVSGTAVGGTIEVPLDLTISAIGPAGAEMTEIEIVGSASVGRVHIPLPGLGTVDDFGFDIDARLAMASRSA